MSLRRNRPAPSVGPGGQRSPERQSTVIELDSRRYHHLSPRAFVEDRRRDRVLLLAGYDPVRFTDQELVHSPDEVVATVVDLLGRAGRMQTRY
ncbi:MAG TPA: DUF559 domain-containing protein [Thermoleophilaceae bacterium]|nr:DUF559 domain-containing protein [Thermoleophilaceae bacterium]